MKEHWRDAYLLALLVVSASIQFSRWVVGLAVAMWVGFAVLNWIAHSRVRN